MRRCLFCRLHRRIWLIYARACPRSAVKGERLNLCHSSATSQGAVSSACRGLAKLRRWFRFELVIELLRLWLWMEFAPCRSLQSRSTDSRSSFSFFFKLRSILIACSSKTSSWICGEFRAKNKLLFCIGCTQCTVPSSPSDTLSDFALFYSDRISLEPVRCLVRDPVHSLLKADIAFSITAVFGLKSVPRHFMLFFLKINQWNDMFWKSTGLCKIRRVARLRIQVFGASVVRTDLGL